MQRLVESLLKLSRANRLELKTTAIDLSAVVQATATHYGEAMTRPIVTKVQPQVTAQAHQDSVEQILVSLLNNAQKYSPAETPITVSLTADDQTVTLAVADQGIGVPDDQKNLIFGRFYRASSVRNSVVGNGLGLAIVQQLVTLSHGQIVVRDNQPQGSVFMVTLPR